MLSINEIRLAGRLVSQRSLQKGVRELVIETDIPEGIAVLAGRARVKVHSYMTEGVPDLQEGTHLTVHGFLHNDSMGAQAVVVAAPRGEIRKIAMAAEPGTGVAQKSSAAPQQTVSTPPPKPPMGKLRMPMAGAGRPMPGLISTLRSPSSAPNSPAASPAAKPASSSTNSSGGLGKLSTIDALRKSKPRQQPAEEDYEPREAPSPYYSSSGPSNVPDDIDQEIPF